MSPLQAKLLGWIQELIEISDVVFLRDDESDLFSGYAEAFAMARKRQREIKQEVFAHLQFETMKSTLEAKA